MNPTYPQKPIRLHKQRKFFPHFHFGDEWWFRCDCLEPGTYLGFDTWEQGRDELIKHNEGHKVMI